MKSLFVLFLAAAVAAQQPIWAQCGGQGWKGATTCASGAHCEVQNMYYSQCLPGGGGAVPAPTKMKTLTKSSSPTPKPSPPTVPSKSQGDFAKTKGLLFEIDGETKYFVGSNAYWLGFLTSNSDVDTVFSHLASSGLKVLRIWGFNDVTSTPSANTVWFQSLVPGQNPVINTGANGLQRLDYAVKSAEHHGIKLIVNFVNNWDAYGGMPAYNAFFGGQHSDWYTNSAIQNQYRTYIKAVVSRYADSKAIFAWELANEARCSGCSADVIYNWAKTTSEFIKSLDKQHMVTLGDEGWAPGGGDGSYPFTTYEGVDFKRNLGIASLDFGTFHMYPSAWGVQNSFATSWIETHAAACAAAGKPCLLEEYGSPSDHIGVEGPWQDAMLAAKSKGLAADFVWQWGDSLSGGQTPDDTFTIYYGSDEWKTLVSGHVAAI